MGGRNWKVKMIQGLAAMAILGMISLSAFAEKGGNGPNSTGGGGGARNKSIPVKAVLESDCGTSCATDAGGWDSEAGWTKVGKYSLLPDSTYTEYSPDEYNVQSEILTHNTVYTLDTLDTLDNGTVGTGTRYIKMHFYFPPTAVNPSTGLPRLPDCWSGTDQNEAVNWSVFSDNSTDFTDMQAGTSYSGFSRLDFNVRDIVANCYTQVFRFWLRWPGVTITRLDDSDGKRRWQVTTNPYGEASLEGQGGKRGQTQYYGDFRMPFKLILTER